MTKEQHQRATVLFSKLEDLFREAGMDREADTYKWTAFKHVVEMQNAEQK